jgi:hypothetical protein
MVISARNVALIVVLALVGPVRGDVFHLDNGDRISGKLLAEGKRSFRIQTRHGRLVIPRAHILRMVRDDGTEVDPNPTPTPAPTPTPEPGCRLALDVAGSVFWYAWMPGEGEQVDPTLRFRVRVEGALVGVFTDAVLDPGAVSAPLVNSFSFSDVSLEPVGPAHLAQPQVDAGAVRLMVGLPVELAGRRRLDVAYQINDGTAEQPSFRDVVFTHADVVLHADREVRVTLAQDRGRMEVAGLFRKRLKHVDTFALDLRPETQ